MARIKTIEKGTEKKNVCTHRTDKNVTKNDLQKSESAPEPKGSSKASNMKTMGIGKTL